jgi:hypothetical protein
MTLPTSWIVIFEPNGEVSIHINELAYLELRMKKYTQDKKDDWVIFDRVGDAVYATSLSQILSYITSTPKSREIGIEMAKTQVIHIDPSKEDWEA